MRWWSFPSASDSSEDDPRGRVRGVPEKAREVEEGKKPVSRVAAVVVVAIWVLCVALAIYLALRVF